MNYTEYRWKFGMNKTNVLEDSELEGLLEIRTHTLIYFPNIQKH